VNSYAQNKGNTEICAGYGMLTYEQFDDLVPQQRREVPYKVTGAIFVTCRHFVSDRFAISLTTGIDNQQGYTNSGNDIVYTWNSFTIATECLIGYNMGKRIMTYGNAAIGYTFSSRENTYTEKAFESYYFNGVNSLTNRSTNVSENYPAFQLSPLCFRSGSKITGFIEIGFGYKGILYGGLLVKL